ncbi:hypothetical protein [Thermotoga sp. KOL6]|nr:hypothetical protein [Thermotoga sp. KOL6]
MRIGMLSFHLVQSNRRLELEIKEMERTYQSLKEEFNYISSHFNLLYPSE